MTVDASVAGALPDLTFCSHRGPFSYRSADGKLVAGQAGPGGLVPVVVPLWEKLGATWLFAAASEEDRAVARAHPLGHQDGKGRLRILEIPPELHRDHYEVISLQFLLPLFHYLFFLPKAPTFDTAFIRAWRSYEEVNARYAQAILESRPAGPVLVQDYHLMLVAAEVERRAGRLPGPLQYFHHVPWCEPDYFSLLPGSLRERLLQALLAFDVVAFHTSRWADAFVRCCERFLPDAVSEGGALRWRGRRIPVVASPAPVDMNRMQALARDPTTKRWLDELQRRRGDRWVLLKAERADLWKNVTRGLLAYESLLRRRPDLARQMWLLALLSRPRVMTIDHEDHLRDALAIAERINASFGEPDSPQPISVLVTKAPQQTEPYRAVAGMLLAEAVLVNPVIDGLNLVSKEAPAISGRDPVLILSRNAGAFEELREGALAVDPMDIEGTATAVEHAFDMGSEERARRASILRAVITARSPDHWLLDQLNTTAER